MIFQAGASIAPRTPLSSSDPEEGSRRSAACGLRRPWTDRWSYWSDAPATWSVISRRTDRTYVSTGSIRCGKGGAATAMGACRKRPTSCVGRSISKTSPLKAIRSRFAGCPVHRRDVEKRLMRRHELRKRRDFEPSIGAGDPHGLPREAPRLCRTTKPMRFVRKPRPTTIRRGPRWCFRRTSRRRTRRDRPKQIASSPPLSTVRTPSASALRAALASAGVPHFASRTTKPIPRRLPRFQSRSRAEKRHCRR